VGGLPARVNERETPRLGGGGGVGVVNKKKDKAEVGKRKGALAQFVGN